MKKNYRSDFLLMLHIYDASGAEVGWPTFDWAAKFYTVFTGKAYEASNIGGVAVNCEDADNCLCIPFDNHGLLPGRLKVMFTAITPSEKYPDRDEKTVTNKSLDVELVPSCDDGAKVLHASIVIPTTVIRYIEKEDDCCCDEIGEDELLAIIGGTALPKPPTTGGCGDDCDCDMEEATDADIEEIAKLTFNS